MRTTSATCLVLLAALLVSSQSSAQSPAGFELGRTVHIMSGATDDDFRTSIQLGAPPAWAKTEAQKMVWSVDEGRQRALVGLAMALGDVYLTSDRKIEKARQTDRSVTGAVRQVVRYAEEVAWDRVPTPGGYSVQVTMRVPRFGPNSLASAFYPDLRKEADARVQEAGHVPVPAVAPTDQSGAEAPEISYTGLVVDARGLGLQPALAPRVLSDSGPILYHISDTRFAESRGVVGYGKALDQPAALRDRIGDSPMVLKAIRKQGSSDVVISDDDARRAMSANLSQNTHFLSDCRVAFLID
jgi:hypothetical protein